LADSCPTETLAQDISLVTARLDALEADRINLMECCFLFEGDQAVKGVSAPP
jgi:hypothetical protein